MKHFQYILEFPFFHKYIKALKTLFVGMGILITLLPGFSQNTCSNYPMEGYAAVSGEGITTTTGGAGGNVVHITTENQLLSWAAAREKNTTPQILHIDGKIKGNSLVNIKHGANISIIGVNGGELQGIGLDIVDYNNVIVRNLKIHEVVYPNDGLTIDECHHVWVDHNEFSSINGPGITVDTYDGLFDIKKSSRFVTVSWNVFHDHKKVMLIGHTDTYDPKTDDKKIRVTIHHNYFYNNDGRNPSLRFGAVHLFNNYFKIIYDYGIAVRQGAHALIENNVYEDVVTPIATDKFDGPEGIVCERGNIFTNTGKSSFTQQDCNWWDSTNLPYKYSLSKTSTVVSLVIKDAGLCNNNANPVRTLPIHLPGIMGVNDATVKAGSFNVYHSPSGAESIIDFFLTEESDITLSLFNSHGKQVRIIKSGTIQAGLHQYTANIAGLTAGIYICKLEVKGTTYTQKVFISNH